MTIDYNVTSPLRTLLVAAVSRVLDADAFYLRMPTMAYEVGGYNISVNGVITGPDNRELVDKLRRLHDFTAIKEEYDKPLPEASEAPAFEELQLTEREELGLGRERHDYPGEDGMQESDVPEPCDINSLVVDMPREQFSDAAIDNLKMIVASKEALIKKALGADVLPIEITEEKLRFPWFTLTGTDGEMDSYLRFVSALCQMAKTKKRITAKEREEENDKFAMRLFLVRLGFVGPEYKVARNILLRNLTGNSAWKNGQPPETIAMEQHSVNAREGDEQNGK